ncbi:acetyltransferase (GNAT) family protein [Halomonas ventosae]|uniref:Acetyltransferase (GNAT) family protein n=1 Tax=Halomonas ventosae TaxID=229007 RepID=A0A4V3DPF2_9GAMM|nr:GNAT family N-acetyltransferase [Halomonas ventosae]TDR52066.1 acetyltransferase (GNAT) family protein [Halomonas ventosae]
MSERTNEALEARTPELARFTSVYLQQALGLSSELGWPYRLKDWAFAQGLGEGFVLERAGRLIGTAMRWQYGHAFSTLGMIIVANAAQGHGYGARLFDALLDDAGSHTLLLNSTKEGLALYGRRGFLPVGEVHQHQGVPTRVLSSPELGCVRAAEVSELPVIDQFDSETVGMPRGRLLQGLSQAGRLSVIVRDGVVTGYAACRRFGRGYVVGPVVAADMTDAQALIEEAISQLPDVFIRIDIPASSGLGSWLETRGLKRVDTVTSMVRGEAPRPSGNARLFALCSQSLG